MRQKKSWGITFLFLLCGTMLGCGEAIEPGTTAPAPSAVIKTAVAVAKVTHNPLVYEAVGSVHAQTTGTLSGKLMGTVKRVQVREGDRVKQGDILVVLDDRQVTAHLEQAQAGLAEARQAESAALSARDEARAGADLAQATYQRYLRLKEEESASRQEFDEVEARHRQAEAALARTGAMVEAARRRIQQAEAAVSSASVSRKDATILAPYDGTVTAKMVEVGDLAAPGTPLVVLEKKGGYRADLVLPENHLQAVRLGQKLKVGISALEDRVLEGVIETIVPSADRQSRSFLVKVTLPRDDSVRSGMFARIQIPLGEERILLIPESAVVSQGQLTGVFLVDAEQIARFRLVRAGKLLGDLVEVVSGLKEGDRYVVSPPPNLVDGAKVEAAS